MHLIRNIALLLVQNMLFSRFLGLRDLTVSIRNRRNLIPPAIITVLFSTVCCGMLGVCRLFLPQNMEMLFEPVISVLICGVFDIICILICILISSRFAKRAVPVIHTAAFSGAVLGITLLSTDSVYDVSGAFRYGFRNGIGFLIAGILIQLAQPALNSENMPKSVRGWRGTVLYAGILSMAIACFARELQI